jgi:hypothetical protein
MADDISQLLEVLPPRRPPAYNANELCDAMSGTQSPLGAHNAPRRQSAGDRGQVCVFLRAFQQVTKLCSA